MLVHMCVSYGASHTFWDTAGALTPAPPVLSDSLRSLSQFFPLEHLPWTEGRSGHGEPLKGRRECGNARGPALEPMEFPMECVCWRCPVPVEADASSAGV